MLIAFWNQVPCLLSSLSASSSVPGPSFRDVHTLAQEPKASTLVPEPRNHILSLSVNANCFTPPSTVKPDPPGLIVKMICFVPPSARPVARLFLVSATRPVENAFGDGFDVGFVVFVSTRSVLPD